MEIWNRETLFVLFSNLKRKYGPYSEWQWRTYPGNRHDDREYARYLVNFSEVVGARSGDAVGFKIVEMMTRVNGPNVEGERKRARIVAAALDAGFLKNSDDGMAKPAHEHHGSIIPLLGNRTAA
jgi:hypothetical protein